MSKLFLSVFNMSIAASWLVLAVLLLRLVLKKAPKWLTVALWAVVAVRLICPVSVESDVSLIPSAQTIPPTIMTDAVPEIHSGIQVFNSAVNPVLQESFVPVADANRNSLQDWISLAAIVWGVGVLAMLVYGVLSYLRVKRRVRTAVLLRDNLYQSEAVASPFVLGFLRPRIYLPFGIDSADMAHVIAHEQAHIRRKDHWWKPVGFAILALHWFNPLMWLGYVLLCRDIELACDEKVVKTLGAAERADYSQALLHCSVGRRTIAACPLAFGEVSVKDRVRSVLSYKKPAFWILLVGLVLSVVLAVCFLTNPTRQINTEISTELSALIEEQIIAHQYSEASLGEFACTDFKVLEVTKEEEIITVYLYVVYGEYEEKNGEVERVAGMHTPEAVTVKKVPNGFVLLEYWEPRDGSYYAEDIRSKFPEYLHETVFDSMGDTKAQRAHCDRKAQEYFSALSTGPINTEALRAKFPMYFDLGTFKGLEVYIWQMAENSYSCGVLPGVNRNYSRKEILALHKNSASLEEMQAIISYYLAEGLAVKEDITLVPVTMPHSSYAYVIDDVYRERLEELFWSSVFLPVDKPAFYYSPIIDEASFDIDGDGKEERCVLNNGPTFGVFTFTFSALEDGELEYFNIFNSPWAELSFETTEDGFGIRARGTGWESFLTIGVDQGNIVIFSDEQNIIYWGVQGLDSPFAPIAAEKIGSLQTIEGDFRTYYRNADGTWQYNGYMYKYRLVIKGRMPNSVAETTYVYLSNIEHISFEEAMWASGLSSQLEAYFMPEEAVLVDIKTEAVPSNIEIVRDGFIFSYTVTDKQGNVLFQKEQSTREPKVLQVSENVYGLVTQAGTGRATNWAVFCDIENGKTSEIMDYVLDARGERVLCGELVNGKHTIVIRNVFGPSLYDLTIPIEDISTTVVEGIVRGEFLDENTALITYYSGETPTLTERIIFIP